MMTMISVSRPHKATELNFCPWICLPPVHFCSMEYKGPLFSLKQRTKNGWGHHNQGRKEKACIISLRQKEVEINKIPADAGHNIATIFPILAASKCLNESGVPLKPHLSKHRHHLITLLLGSHQCSPFGAAQEHVGFVAVGVELDCNFITNR